MFKKGIIFYQDTSFWQVLNFVLQKYVKAKLKQARWHGKS